MYASTHSLMEVLKERNIVVVVLVVVVFSEYVFEKSVKAKHTAIHVWWDGKGEKEIHEKMK